MASVSAKVFAHHQKKDGSYNVKIIVYHKKVRKYIDTNHWVSKRQLDTGGWNLNGYILIQNKDGQQPTLKETMSLLIENYMSKSKFDKHIDEYINISFISKK